MYDKDSKTKKLVLKVGKAMMLEQDFKKLLTKKHGKTRNLRVGIEMLPAASCWPVSSANIYLAEGIPIVEDLETVNRDVESFPKESSDTFYARSRIRFGMYARWLREWRNERV